MYLCTQVSDGDIPVVAVFKGGHFLLHHSGMG